MENTKNEGYQLFIEIFPFEIQRNHEMNHLNIPHEGRLVRKAQIKQIHRSNTTRPVTEPKQRKTTNIRRVTQPNSIPNEKVENRFLILIEMTDKTTYVELFDDEDMHTRGLLPDDVDKIGYARKKRDERYDALRQILTNHMPFNIT